MFEKLERSIVSKIQKLATCSAVFENDICKQLSFTDQNNVYYGTLRHSDCKKEVFVLIDCLKSLQYLDLKKCRLLQIPELELPNLTHLNLSSNYLGCVPEWLKRLKLTYLDLGVNELTSVPEWFSDQSFDVLKLHKNRISHFPRLKTTIKSLNLYLNTAKSIPDFLWDLDQLEFFSWGMSQITEIPDGIGNLIKIKWLSFVPNEIETLPDSFCNLINLQGVRFAKNRITRLPKDFGNLLKLEQLTLYDNQIQELPESFFNLHLKELNIAKNPLRSDVVIKLQTTFAHLGSIFTQSPFASCLI